MRLQVHEIKRIRCGEDIEMFKDVALETLGFWQDTETVDQLMLEFIANLIHFNDKYVFDFNMFHHCWQMQLKNEKK